MANLRNLAIGREYSERGTIFVKKGEGGGGGGGGVGPWKSRQDKVEKYFNKENISL